MNSQVSKKGHYRFTAGLGFIVLRADLSVWHVVQDLLIGGRIKYKSLQVGLTINSDSLYEQL